MTIPLTIHGNEDTVKKKAFSRAEREVMIVALFALEISKGEPNEMTMYKIAKKLGLSPSAHLSRILSQMVVDGKLDTYTRPNKGRWTTWFYCLPEGSYVKPKKRMIAIKRNGVLEGQLELW